MDEFLAAVSRPSPNFASDPGPDPRNDCATCGGFGIVKTSIINGRQVALDRFEYIKLNSKGFACSDCYPKPKPNQKL